MTNLTDKWKKGELPKETECYVRVNGDIYLGSIQYKNGYHNKKLPYVKSFNGQFITKYVEEVLAEVPSYEEVVAMKDCLKMVRKAAEREVKLKKLLKECEELMGDGTTYMHIDVYQRRKKDVMNAINQVLGEE